MPNLYDPRSSLVDGSHEIPIDVAARQDIAQGLKMYFGDLYYNDTLALILTDLENCTLADLSRQHANCYQEVQRLRKECIARGVDFSDEQIRKLRDYHVGRAEIINGIIARRLEAKKERED